VDSTHKSAVLGQAVTRTREADRAAEEAAAAAPARGLAASFDSAEATQRLASLTGVAAPQTATQAIKSIQRPPSGRWRRRDWLMVAGAAVCGLVAVRAILKRGR